MVRPYPFVISPTIFPPGSENHANFFPSGNGTGPTTFFPPASAIRGNCRQRRRYCEGVMPVRA
jgi:hypothetical protein